MNKSRADFICIDGVEFKDCEFNNLEFVTLYNCKFTNCVFNECDLADYHALRAKGNIFTECSTNGKSFICHVNIAEENTRKYEEKDKIATKELSSITHGYKVVPGFYLVKATFPEGTEFRGNVEDKFRTSQAYIEDIIPLYDPKEGIYNQYGEIFTKYCVGEIAKPDKFSKSKDSCSNGLHFCAKDVASNNIPNYISMDLPNIEMLHKIMNEQPE